MSPKILEALHSRPIVQLHVINTERHNTPMDKALLTSPQLHTLDFAVYIRKYANRDKQIMSGYHVFEICLMRAEKLRVLLLLFEGISVITPCELTDDEANMPFKDDIEDDCRLPTLRELTIDCQDMTFLSEPHADMWLKRMNWSHLKVLNLGHTCPQYIIPALIGLIPQLKSQTFGFDFHEQDPSEPWRNAEPDAMRRFLDSIDALKSVILFGWNNVRTALVRPALFSKHSRSLKQLDVQVGKLDTFSESDFTALLDNALDLEYLCKTARMRTEDRRPDSRSYWVRFTSYHPGDVQLTSHHSPPPFNLHSPNSATCYISNCISISCPTATKSPPQAPTKKNPPWTSEQTQSTLATWSTVSAKIRR